MILGNYEKIVKVISKSSGLGEDEIEKRVQEKRNKLSGLISKEGAAQVIAAELGISFENEKLKIDEILPDMKRVNTKGKVIGLSPVRTFNRNGKEGKVVNLTIADDTSNVKVVLWDAHHIDLVEKGEINEGVVVELANGNMREGEIHLGSFSEIKPTTEEMGEVVTQKQIKTKNIDKFHVGEVVGSRAFVVQAFEPRFFHVCPECSKKVVQEGESFNCSEHGNVVPEKRGVMNIVLDDGTETIRAVLFHENLKLVGVVSLEDPEKMANEKQALVGKEMIFSGNVRNNDYFNSKEVIISGIKEVNPDELLSELEQNAD